MSNQKDLELQLNEKAIINLKRLKFKSNNLKN